MARACFPFGRMFDALSTDLDAIAANLQKRVGSNLRALRERRGLTQDHLAHLAGLATRHLQKIEAGQVNVTLRTVVPRDNQREKAASIRMRMPLVA